MNISSSQIKLFGIVAAIIVVFVLAFTFFTRGSLSGTQDVNLVVWGVGDTQQDLQEAFDSFGALVKSSGAYENIKLTITYRAWRPEEYEDLLLNQLAEGKGPDIFYIHNTWLPKYHSKLVALPATGMSLDAFREQFVSVAAQDLIYDRQIYALPHYVDTLATYYNAQQYQGAAMDTSRPAPTWSAFRAQVAALTNKNGEQISRSGVALGTAENIRYAVDLLYLYLLQRGADVCDGTDCDAIVIDDSSDFKAALRDYLSYSDNTSANYSWNSNYLTGLQSSNIFNDIDAFIRGRVSTIFAYASDYQQIKTLGAGNNLRFEIAEIPQADDAATSDKIAFASYWAMAVSRNSGHPQLAWDFIQHMTSRPVLAEYYDRHPRPVSREDMINTSTDNPLRVFDRQSKYAQSLAIYDRTRFAEVLSSGIEKLATKGGTLTDVVKEMDDRLNTVMAPYHNLN